MAGAVQPAQWLWTLVAAAILSQTALNLARLLISYKALALGGDAVAVGFISAAFAALPIMIAIALGRLSDNVARLRPLIVAGLVTLTFSCVLLSFSQSLVLIGVASAALGLGHLAFAVAGQSAIAKLAASSRVDAGFGWFTAGFAVGQLVGPLLAGFMLSGADAVTSPDRLDDINRASLVAGMVVLAAVPFILFRRVVPKAVEGMPEPVHAPVVKDSVMTILSQSGVKSNMLASLAILTTMDILTAFLPLVAEEQSITPLIVGVLLAIRALASILSRLLLTQLLRRWDRDHLVLASVLGAAVGLALIPLVITTFWVSGLSLILVGFFLGIGQPMTMALISQAVREESRGAALAVRLLGNRVGQIVMPAAAGLAAAPLGPSASIWMTCLMLGASGVIKSREIRT